MKRSKPCQHYRRIKTKRGTKVRLVNKGVHKKRRTVYRDKEKLFETFTRRNQDKLRLVFMENGKLKESVPVNIHNSDLYSHDLKIKKSMRNLIDKKGYYWISDRGEKEAEFDKLKHERERKREKLRNGSSQIPVGFFDVDLTGDKKQIQTRIEKLKGIYISPKQLEKDKKIEDLIRKQATTFNKQNQYEKKEEAKPIDHTSTPAWKEYLLRKEQRIVELNQQKLDEENKLNKKKK